ncbi:hypothetical protein BH14960 [Bartonella henselae str. Houston-1]|uniref:Uncharacterized protein n=1 Tax=Bartonella henselae (strain ATCC 49882 / DSM 28221 / CCUG 30454 / Houston 1) TaxID=283166 RepID=A0A0H3M6W5_BARHE|nr:hypothetical protein BH14960 [Bartonella henselae str. Houston-1]
MNEGLSTFILHPSFSIPHSSSLILHLSSSTPHSPSLTLHLSSSTSHPPPLILQRSLPHSKIVTSQTVLIVIVNPLKFLYDLKDVLVAYATTNRDLKTLNPSVKMNPLMWVSRNSGRFCYVQVLQALKAKS